MAQVIFEFEAMFLEALRVSLRELTRTQVDLVLVRLTPGVRAPLFMFLMDLVLVNQFQLVLDLATVLQFPFDFIVPRFP